MILKLGSRGGDVETLQIKLKAAGYDCGDVDGNFGPKTAAAVLAFQIDRPDIDDDKIAGPMTLGALDAAIAKRTAAQPKPDAPPAPVTCEAATWAAFRGLVTAVTEHPVKYGPGRGLWVDDKFVITHGPGALESKSWPNFLGKTYPSFHCSSWTNFFLAWLLRRNELFTHAGNIPNLFDVLEGSPWVHKNPDAGPWRGYGPETSPIAPDGSAATRNGVPNVVDARELLARRTDLPTFIVCGQSTKRANGWLWWHHTVVFVVDHRDGSRLYRIAADGYRDPARGYSAQPMRWVEITAQSVKALDGAIYRAWGVDTTDGTYGDKTKPIAGVTFES